jgi:hypothetical protein
MRNIVNETGEIIAKASDDNTLVGGQHRIMLASSLGQKMYWQDNGQLVTIDTFLRPSTHRHIT